MLLLLQRVAVPIRGPESLPWVAERMTQYGGCGVRVKGGMEAMSLSNATQLTKEDVTRDDPPRHEWLARVKGRTAWLEEGTRMVSRTCCALSWGGVRRQETGHRVKVEHIAGRAAEKAPHVGPC